MRHMVYLTVYYRIFFVFGLTFSTWYNLKIILLDTFSSNNIQNIKNIKDSNKLKIFLFLYIKFLTCSSKIQK